jgi:quercetin dioxygenase-like cupin family protein
LKRALPLAVIAVLASWALAQNAAAPVVKTASQIDWKASGSLPPGAEYHLLYEDPATHGVHTLVRFPKGYGLPPHSHTADETIVVLKGKLVIEIAGKSETLAAGGYAVLPGGTVFSLKTAGFGGADFLAAFNGPVDMKDPASAAKP